MNFLLNTYIQFSTNLEVLSSFTLQNENRYGCCHFVCKSLVLPSDMAVAIQETQARLNIGLQDIVTFFEETSLVPRRSIEILVDYIDRKLTNEFLHLAEAYGRSMAFIDHDELINRLYNAWNLLLEGYIIGKWSTGHLIKESR